MSDQAFTHEPPAVAPETTALTDQAPPQPVFAPIAPSERLANLDFARGLALLGILFVNVASFFGPFASMMAPSVYATYSGADRVAALLVLSLFATKFISIFSLLFGYGLAGQIERAAERGGSPVWFTFWRLAALALFGLVHALWLWYGDILFIYAWLGACLLLARYLPTKWLVLVAVLLLLLAVGLRAGLTGLQIAYGGAMAPPTTARAPAGDRAPRGLEAIQQARFNPASPIWVNAETAAFRDGPLGDAIVFRLAQWLFVLIVMPFFPAWQVLGMFFLGAALYRARFFSPEQAALRRRILLTCLPLGGAFEGAAAWVYWTTPPSNFPAWGVAGILQQAGLLFLPLGYLALFAVIADRLPAAVRVPVSSAGRMSLTVYLGETVLATTLSYWWGLRLFGQVGPAAQAGLALGIWLTLVLFSTLWLTRFTQGPMEWLWRRMAYHARG